MKFEMKRLNESFDEKMKNIFGLNECRSTSLLSAGANLDFYVFSSLLCFLTTLMELRWQLSELVKMLSEGVWQDGKARLLNSEQSSDSVVFDWNGRIFNERVD